MPSSALKTSALDRKSTRLNSSHTLISYAVFCLKKQKLVEPNTRPPATSQAARRNENARAHPASLSPSSVKQDRERRSPVVAAGVGFFFLMIGQPRRSTLFPHTTLFR